MTWLGAAHSSGLLGVAANMTDEPLLPVWIAMPLAILAIVVVAAHVASMYRSGEIPPSRRRIRVANAWLMVVAIPLLACAVSVVTPARQRAFVLVWLAAIGLVLMILVVALIDVLNNHRLHARSRRALRQEFERARRAVADEMTRAAGIGVANNPDADGTGKQGNSGV